LGADSPDAARCAAELGTTDEFPAATALAVTLALILPGRSWRWLCAPSRRQ